MNHFHISRDRSPPATTTCTHVRSLPIHLSHVCTVAEQTPMRLFQELKIVYPSLFCVVPPPAASCHCSLLFSQEISQTSPELDLMCTKISAYQGVLQLCIHLMPRLSFSFSVCLHLTPATARKVFQSHASSLSLLK